MQNNKGFTVIELMAIVAIVSILSVIALAVYGDFVVRGKVSEGLVFAAEAKTSVNDYYYTNNSTMPQNNNQAGLQDKDDYNAYDYIRRLEITSQPVDGTITITFKIPGTKADNKLLQLVPTTIDGTLVWNCIAPDTNGINSSQVPPNCRG